MNIGIAQTVPRLGDVKYNFEQHLNTIEKAKKDNLDLLLFPELSLTGYTLQDLVPEVALQPEDNPYFNEFKSLSRDISISLGFVEDKDNGLFFNSAVYFSKGEISHIHRKVFLPTYGMFEEGKFFAQGKNFKTFSTPFGPTGMMICYDFLHYGACYLLFCGGAEIILVSSAAPGRGFDEKPVFATSHMWELMGETISRFSSCFVIYCNRAGIEDGKTFAGGSFIFNPAGKLLAKAAYAEEDYLIQEICLEDIRTMHKTLPYRRDNKPEIILQALQRIIKTYED